MCFVRFLAFSGGPPVFPRRFVAPARIFTEDFSRTGAPRRSFPHFQPSFQHFTLSVSLDFIPQERRSAGSGEKFSTFSTCFFRFRDVEILLQTGVALSVALPSGRTSRIPLFSVCSPIFAWNFVTPARIFTEDFSRMDTLGRSFQHFQPSFQHFDLSVSLDFIPQERRPADSGEKFSTFSTCFFHFRDVEILLQTGVALPIALLSGWTSRIPLFSVCPPIFAWNFVAPSRIFMENFPRTGSLRRSFPHFQPSFQHFDLSVSLDFMPQKRRSLDSGEKFSTFSTRFFRF